MIYGAVLCFGDSLTFGSRDENGLGYPIYLAEDLSEEFGQDWVAIIEATPGITSAELLRRAYSVFRSYPEAHEVVLLVGTNDGKDSVATPPWRYRRNVEYIIRCARVLGKKLYLCLIPDLLGFGAPDYTVRTAERIRAYNREIEALAAEFDVKLVDLRGMASECYSDGVHMNAEGYREVARRVKSALLEERQWR